MRRRVSRRAFLGQGSAAAAAGGLLISKTVLLEAQPLPRAVADSYTNTAHPTTNFGTKTLLDVESGCTCVLSSASPPVLRVHAAPSGLASSPMRCSRNRARLAASAARFFSSSKPIGPPSRHPRLRLYTRVSRLQPRNPVWIGCQSVSPKTLAGFPAVPYNGWIVKILRREAPSVLTKLNPG